MEGRERAIEAYHPNPISRLFTEFCCCMPSIFRKKKLLRKGFYDIVYTDDPEMVIWEHIGISFWSKFIRYTAAFICSLSFFVISFIVLWAMA